MNQEGNCTHLEYQEANGIFRIAKPTGTEYHVDPLPSTTDCWWDVQKRGSSNWDGPYEGLTYLGTDGNIWVTKVHCEYDGAQGCIHVWFESETNGQGNNSTMEIIDWGGQSWAVHINNVRGNSGVPSFVLTKK